MGTHKAFGLPGFGSCLGANLIIALMYSSLAELSRHLASTANAVTPVWPSDGLAVGVTLLYGNGMLPGVFLGSFLANIAAFWNLNSWVTLLISVLAVLGIAAGTTLGTWLGTSLLRRATRQRYPFNRVADSIKFLIYAGLISPIVNATIGVSILVFAQKVPQSAYHSIWPIWWISNVAGILILTPVILSWSDWIQSQKFSFNPKYFNFSHIVRWLMVWNIKGIEALVLIGFIFLIGKASFWNNYPLAYMLIPLLVWSAFRFGQPGTTLTMFLISAIAILGTVRGLGTFTKADLNQSLIALQSFIAVVVFTSLILVAVLSERMQAELQLKKAFSELQVSNTALAKHSQELAENNHWLEQTLQELGRTQAQMIQGEKMSALGNLIAGVAHEINNPVGFLEGNIQPAIDYIKDLLGLVDLYQKQYPQNNVVIQNEIETIDLEFLRQDLPKLIYSMNEGVNRIKAISTSLRTFSRADNARPVPFNLHQGLDSTILILQHRLRANEKRSAIDIITNYGDIPPVECYAGQMNQVFMNILANAIDALDDSCEGLSFEETKKNPRQITITTGLSHDQQCVVIRLKDNGIGMSEDVKAKIFDALFTTKGVGKGTGLGLAIAHQIVVEKHNASLEVDSALGQGSEFIITLPVKFLAVN
ncbi:MAG: MASE1 domain-containing protein [Gloeotrichia echinulata DEX184]|jgi:two-component system NtrC family sensor kinase